MRPDAKNRHPSSRARADRRFVAARPPSPGRAAGLVAALVLVATLALIAWRPDTSAASTTVLAGIGALVAIVSAGLSAAELRRRHARRRSEVAWVTRELETGGRLRSIVSSLQEGLVFYDRDLRIVEYNPAAERILGLGSRVRGLLADSIPNWRAVHEDGTEWPQETHPVFVTMRTGEASSGLVMGVERPDVPTVWISVNAQPVRDAGGEVDGVIVTFTDISEHRAAEEALRSSEQRVDEATEALEWQAYHDPLTKLPNRALLIDRLAASVSRKREDGSRCALLYLDLDRFKNVNDTLGHEAGDNLLVEVAGRLREALRPGDLVARLGGDEFVVLVDELSRREEASHLADRLRASVSRPIVLGSSVVTITTSVGIALDVDHRATSLLRDADTALYKAKEHGRDRWEIFDDSLRAATIRRVAAEQLIRQALDEDGLRVHYQPLVDLVTGQVVGAEALLRMIGPHGDLLTPSSFISIAEETGLIVPLGAGVLDDACQQLSRWRDELGALAPATVSVNLASRQLSTAGFDEVVRRSLERHCIKPADLTLELTESTLIEAGRGALDTVVALHDMGVRLAIDDFGTGYSSLSYLKRFPVDIVKIDRSFVDGLGDGGHDTEIVKAVLALGQALGLVTVAEGVETQEQLESLRSLGCDAAQGYLFSRPVPSPEVGDAVRRINHLAYEG